MDQQLWQRTFANNLALTCVLFVVSPMQIYNEREEDEQGNIQNIQVAEKMSTKK